MDQTRFDGWTRRRFGLAAGGVASTVLLGGLRVAAADANRKRRRKKRCKRFADTCIPGGKRKCCGDLRCQPREIKEDLEFFCCKAEDAPCSGPGECCPGLVCDVGFCVVDMMQRTVSS